MTHKTNTQIKTASLALYEPDIPQNTAAIMRLCACLGVTLEIIEPCGFQLDDKRIKRVAMDYIKSCKILRHKSYDSFLENKTKSRIILMTTKAKKKFNKFKFRLSDTILIGRESSGVPNKVHKSSHEKLKIPLKNNMRSLNVVTASAIALSEVLRQNNYY